MKERTTWYSARVERDVTLARWGRSARRSCSSRPPAATPRRSSASTSSTRSVSCSTPAASRSTPATASPDACCWRSEGDAGQRTWLQNQFHEFVRREVVPAIRTDCQTPDIEIIAAGASIGAFNALAVLCR